MLITVRLGSPLLLRSQPMALCVRAVVEGLVMADMIQLEKGDYPPLYEAGVEYQVEPYSHEHFDDVSTVYARGWGDCDDLVAWRVAELQLAGEPASVRINWKRYLEDDLQLFHCRVRRGDGSIEDPSKILGMRG